MLAIVRDIYAIDAELPRAFRECGWGRGRVKSVWQCRYPHSITISIPPNGTQNISDIQTCRPA